MATETEIARSLRRSIWVSMGDMNILLSDSRSGKKLPKGLLLADSTTIGLFKEILKSSGRKRLDGRQKGGIKAHTVIPADRYVASFIHYTSAATHNSCLMDELPLEEGDMTCFDKAYID